MQLHCNIFHARLEAWQYLLTFFASYNPMINSWWLFTQFGAISFWWMLFFHSAIVDWSCRIQCTSFKRNFNSKLNTVMWLVYTYVRVLIHVNWTQVLLYPIWLLIFEMLCSSFPQIRFTEGHTKMSNLNILIQIFGTEYSFQEHWMVSVSSSSG